jgi:predicted Zn-dependent peptidase
VKEKYGFNKMIIAASGAVEHEKILKLIEKYFHKDLGTSGVKRKFYGHSNIPAKVELIDKEIQQVHAIIGKSTFGYKSDLRNKVAVLTQILGEGSSSRLFQSIRERNGIAYQVNSFLNSFYDVSSFGVYLSTNEKTMDKALSIVDREFKKMKNTKVSERELNKAKEAMKGQFLLSLENTSNRMFRMAQSELYNNRIKTTDEIIREIDSVKREDILDLANDLLDENTFIKIIIKSKDTLLKSAA